MFILGLLLGFTFMVFSALIAFGDNPIYLKLELVFDF